MKDNNPSRIFVSGMRTWSATFLIPVLLSIPLSVEATSFSLDAPVSIRINGAETDNLQGYKATLSGLIGIIGISHEEYSYDVTFQSCADELPPPVCNPKIDASVTSILLELPGETIRTIIGYGVGTARLSKKITYSAPPPAISTNFDTMEWGKADITQTLLQIIYKPKNSALGVDFGFHQFNIQGKARHIHDGPESPQERSFSEQGTLIYLGLTLFFS